MEPNRTELIIRPVTRADRGRLADAFARLGRESRYERFLHPKPQLSDAELDYFSDVDGVTHDALAAVDPRDGSFVGVARYAVLDDRAMSADLAFSVIDEWQGRGVGTVLLGELLPRAAANGIERFVALTLRDNAPARALLARYGFHKVDTTHGVAELHLALRESLLIPA
jgi:RimJ/RimL family protein N-acetyltransferase